MVRFVAFIAGSFPDLILSKLAVIVTPEIVTTEVSNG